MSRFLLLAQYFPPEVGAAQVRLFEIARYLKSRGHEVVVLTAMPNYPGGTILPAYQRKLWLREEMDGIPVLRTCVWPARGRNPLLRIVNYTSFCASSFVASLFMRGFDYVFVESPPILLAFVAWCNGWLYGARIILNVADIWSESVALLVGGDNALVIWTNRALERCAYRLAYRINAVTDGVAASIVRVEPSAAEKLLHLPNGVNLELFGRPAGRRADVPQLLDVDVPVFSFIGTHGRLHGLDVILDAAAQLKKEARFLFVGDGSEKSRLVHRARALGLDNVTFIDSRPVHEVPALLELSRAALVPLSGDAASRTVRPAKMFSAMAAGKAIIYSGDGEGAALVETAQCGLVVPPGNADALADAIRQLASDPARARRLGLNGRRLAEREYGWESIVDRWLSDLDRGTQVAAAAKTEAAIHA